MSTTSKVATVSSRLRQTIVAGRRRAGERLPAQSELATRFGVSPVTMQRAIEELVRQGFLVTRRRSGTYVADTLPHQQHFGLVFVDSPTDPHTWTLFHAAIANEAQALANRRDIHLQTYYGVNGHVDAGDYLDLLQQVAEGRLGGIILAAYPSPILSTPLLQSRDLPRVAIMGRPALPGIPRVWMDIEGLVDQAVAELAARGRRRVVFVMSDGMYSHCPEHFGAALARHGLPAEDWRIQIASRRPADAVRHQVQLLLRGPADERPDGLIILDDNLVADACAGVVASGLSVPTELSIVSHSNFPWQPASVLPTIPIGFHMPDVLDACIDSLAAQRRGETPGAVCVPAITAPVSTTLHAPRNAPHASALPYP